MSNPHICPTCGKGRLDEKGIVSLPNECCAIYFFGVESYVHHAWLSYASWQALAPALRTDVFIAVTGPF